MTLDELAVLRELARWRRNHGHEYVVGHGLTPTYRLADGGAICWLGPRSHATCMKIGVTRDYGKVLLVWHRVESVSQALDLLAMLGYLPLRFSSVYRAGWEAAATWFVGDSDSERFKAMFHDPDNISFPAGEVAW